MKNLTNEYQKLLKNLEQNIKNKDDIEYVRSELMNLFIIFFNELSDLKDLYQLKMDTILEHQDNFYKKINKIENSINNIKKDIYMDETSDFEILCPYCGNEFVIELDEIRDEVECPNCKNTIELDWNNIDEDGCDGGCSNCNGYNCLDDYDEDEDEDM